MANWYARAIDQLEKIGDGFSASNKLREIAVDYAKRHPKAFFEAAIYGPDRKWEKECIDLVKSDRLASAIKLRRDKTGESLKDAKFWCDQYNQIKTYGDSAQ